jgi:hypothetical protein
MSSYESYKPSEESIISKELLNKNRVLTMSNNRKCNYLIVDVSKEETIMMAVNTQGKSKDILVIKSFVNKKFSELVDEVYWLCREFDISIVLNDNRGFGIGFYDEFLNSISENSISIRAIDNSKIASSNAFVNIINDLGFGNLRFLQTPELAKNTYVKPFLGISTIAEYHKETDKLINEISNIKFKLHLGNISFDRISSDLGKARFNCLLSFYAYPENGIIDKIDKESINKDYDITKTMSNYEVIHGTFYKHVFKCIENEKTKVIFYHNGTNKLKQFLNICNETEFKNLFSKDIAATLIGKDSLEIRFHNGSLILFAYGGASSKGTRCHFAVVDKEINREIYDDVIQPSSILFDIQKTEKDFKDIYNIEFIDM